MLQNLEIYSLNTMNLSKCRLQYRTSELYHTATGQNVFEQKIFYTSFYHLIISYHCI